MFPGNPAGAGANLTGPTLVATNMNIDDSTGPALVDTTPCPNSTGPTPVATNMNIDDSTGPALVASLPAAKYFIFSLYRE